MIPSHHPVPLDAGVARLAGQLDENRYEFFAERSGILEFDARLPRLDAERLALIQTLARYGFPPPPPPLTCLLQVEIDGATRWALTADETTARQRLADMGAAAMTAVEVAETLQEHFDDLAWLAIAP